MTVFVVTIRGTGEEYHSEVDEPRVFASHAAALDWVWQDLPAILSAARGRTVYLAPTERPYGTQWSAVAYPMGGVQCPLGIRINLTSTTLVGGEA